MRRYMTAIILFSLYAVGVDGEKVFEKACVSCHMKEHKHTLTMQEFLTRKAPSMAVVSKHIKKNIKIVDDLDDEIHRAVVIAFIKDYVEYPHLDKAMCEAVALEKFNLMPSLKGLLTAEELNAVATWVYDYYEKREKEPKK